MCSDDPVTLWLEDLRKADPSAAQRLWNHFVGRLCEAARVKFGTTPRRVYDEDDAAQSAFRSFCLGLTAGKFPDIRDRNELWGLLLAITARKVSHRRRFDKQQRRDVRRNLPCPCLVDAVDNSSRQDVKALVSREPTPEFVAEFFDVIATLMVRLDDSSLQHVAELRIEGYNEAEIAARLQCSRSTVNRRLEVIRRRWRELEQSDG